MVLLRNLELESAIVDHPHDLERYAVYGDWLSQRGDPRGALMVAGSELARCDGDDETGRARRTRLRHTVSELWREHRVQIEGALADASLRGLALDWELGGVDAATLVLPPDDDGRDTLSLVLEHPAAFALSKIHLVTASLGEHGFNYQPLVDQIAEHAPTTLRDLALGELDGWTDDETVVLGDLRPLFARHNRLAKLTLAGRPSTVSAPSMLPCLRELTLRPVGLSRTWLRVFNAESWPRLERFTFSYESALDANFEWLHASRIAQRLPALRHLALVATGDAYRVIDALAATGLGRQLYTLDVSVGRFGADEAARLDEERDEFPLLKRLLVGKLPKGQTWQLPWLELAES